MYGKKRIVLRRDGFIAACGEGSYQVIGKYYTWCGGYRVLNLRHDIIGDVDSREQVKRTAHYNAIKCGEPYLFFNDDMGLK